MASLLVTCQQEQTEKERKRRDRPVRNTDADTIVLQAVAVNVTLIDVLTFDINIF